MRKSPEVTIELRRISAENLGMLRAADVVEAAADAASPLHSFFEWDDSEAGYLYRLQQARALIRVTVEVLQYQEQHYRVRAFISLAEDRILEGGGYRVMTQVLSSPTGRAKLLDQALRELNSFKVRYQELTELTGVFAAVERASRIYESNGPPPPPSGGEPNDTATL